MRLYPFSFSPISFYFAQTPRDFVVQEIPLYEWSNEGEHLILQIRKKSLSTQEMLKIIASTLGCKTKHIGYAGLKDKNALTTQFISLPYSFKSQVIQAQEVLEQKNIKILSYHRHCNKIRIGHLKGNTFFIRLKKIHPQDLNKIENILKRIENEGFPNYFGYQRFGKFGDNYLEGQKILQGEKKIKDKKLAEFLVSSYQSYLFNQWLSKRIQFNKICEEFSAKECALAIQKEFDLDLEPDSIQTILSQKQHFKILEGDILHHFPFGKIFLSENILQESDRFRTKSIVPCGVLSGKKTILPHSLALKMQEDFLDPSISEGGSYRFAWVFPQDLTYRYIPEKAHLELHFFLPKGSYATVFLETLANREIKGD